MFIFSYRYACENGCLVDARACEKAARNGHLECMKYACEKGAIWNESICTSAAKGGYLNCLRYDFRRVGRADGVEEWRVWE